MHAALLGLAIALFVVSAHAENGEGGEGAFGGAAGAHGGPTPARALPPRSVPAPPVVSAPPPIASAIPGLAPSPSAVASAPEPLPSASVAPAPVLPPEPEWLPDPKQPSSASGGSASIAPSAGGHAGATHPAPAPAASSPELQAKPVAVRLGDTSVFLVRSPLGGRSADERARIASRALAATFEDPKNNVRVVSQGDIAVIYVGTAPVIQLTPVDAELAGDASVEVHAANVATAIRQALAAERQRSRVARNVFSLSLVVFFALIAFYLMKKIGDVADRARTYVDDHGDRVLAIRVQKIELVRPAVLKSTALVGLWLAKWFGQFGVLYAWLVIVLSLFESTRGYTERLTGFVVSPFSQFMQRIATTLPLLVVAAIAALSVFVLVRFVGLFFAGVARRETALHWLPPDLAAPTSVLLRVGIVISALVFAAPVVTGDPDGALGRAGAIALAAVGLASTPLLATGLIGTVVLFGRRLRVGEHVSFSGCPGRISSINLFEIRLEMVGRSELRIPHLALLRMPLQGLGPRPRVSVDLIVAADSAPSRVIPVLDQAANRVGRDVMVDVIFADGDGIQYRVSAICDSLDAHSLLAVALLEALSAAGLALGRGNGASRGA